VKKRRVKRWGKAFKPPKFRDPKHVIQWVLESTKALAGLRQIANQMGTWERIEFDWHQTTNRVTATTMKALEEFKPEARAE